MFKGGVIQIEIKWECNYDRFWKDCQPAYSFSRFDVPFKEVSAASGFNFRFSDKYETEKTEYRVLTKAYGLRFIINVIGKAGKFNFVPLLLTLGAGIGLLSVATILADIFLITCTKKKAVYRQLKELDYDENDGENDDPMLNKIV
jgi:P2X purinoceptor 4